MDKSLICNVVANCLRALFVTSIIICAIFIPIYLSPNIDFPHNYKSIDQMCVTGMHLVKKPCEYPDTKILVTCYTSYIDFTYWNNQTNQLSSCALERRTSFEDPNVLYLDFALNVVNGSCSQGYSWHTHPETCYTEIDSAQDNYEGFQVGFYVGIVILFLLWTSCCLSCCYPHEPKELEAKPVHGQKRQLAVNSSFTDLHIPLYPTVVHASDATVVQVDWSDYLSIVICLIEKRIEITSQLLYIKFVWM